MRATIYRSDFDVESLLRPLPRTPSPVAVWAVSAVIGLPVTLLVNYIVNGQCSGPLVLWPLMTWISHEACHACFVEKED